MASVIRKESSSRLIKVPEVLQQKIIQYSTSYNERAVENYYNLVQQSDTTNICLICLEACGPSEIQKIAKCSHTFCQECLHNYLIYKISTGDQISCPSATCTQIIPKTSYSYKQLPKWTRDRYDKIQLKKQNLDNKNKRLCGGGTNCIGTVDFNEKNPRCDTCDTEFCSICRLRKHAGEDCSEAYTSFFNQWRRCPDCKEFIQKSQGGNKMICRSCKNPFCAVCQQPWKEWHNQCQKQVDPVLDKVYDKQSILQCCRCWNIFKGILFVLLLPFILLLALVAVILVFILSIIGGFIFSPCYARAEGYAPWATILLCPCIGVYAVGYAINHFLCQSLKLAYNHLKKYCNTIKVLFTYDPSQRDLRQTQSNAIEF